MEDSDEVTKIDIDEALDRCGGYRRWHITIFVLLGVSLFLPLCWQALVLVFVGWTPPHHCRLPPGQSANQSIPLMYSDNSHVTLAQCSMYSNSTSNETIPCSDGWTYESDGYYTIVQQWDLVCERNYLAELAQTLFQIGCLFAEVAFSYLVDRFGRKLVHIVSHLVIWILGVGVAFVDSYIAFVVLRSILGMIIVANCNSGLTYLTEMFDSKRRAFAGIGLELQWIGCYLSLPLMAYYILDWRVLQIVISCGSAVWVIYFWILPESPAWLAAAGRYDEAEEVLTNMARWNGVPLTSPIRLLRAGEGGNTENSQLKRDDASSACPGHTDGKVQGYSLQTLDKQKVDSVGKTECENKLARSLQNVHNNPVESDVKRSPGGGTITDVADTCGHVGVKHVKVTNDNDGLRQDRSACVDTRASGDPESFVQNGINDSPRSATDSRHISVLPTVPEDTTVPEVQSQLAPTSETPSVNGGVLNNMSSRMRSKSECPAVNGSSRMYRNARRVRSEKSRGNLRRDTLPAFSAAHGVQLPRNLTGSAASSVQSIAAEMSTLQQPAHVPIRDMLTDRQMRLHIIVCSILWFANCTVYYGLILSTPSLAGNRFLNFLIMGFVELPAVLLALYTTDRFGRRLTTAVYHVLAGLPLSVVVFVPLQTSSGTDLSAVVITLVMVSKFFISASFAVIILYTKELFPTNLRGTSSGVCQILGRIGNILTPFAAYAGKTSLYWMPNVMFGIVSIFAAAVTMLLPETTGKPLPQTLEDVHALTKPLRPKVAPTKVEDGVDTTTYGAQSGKNGAI